MLEIHHVDSGLYIDAVCADLPVVQCFHGMLSLYILLPRCLQHRRAETIQDLDVGLTIASPAQLAACSNLL